MNQEFDFVLQHRLARFLLFSQDGGARLILFQLVDHVVQLILELLLFFLVCVRIYQLFQLVQFVLNNLLFVVQLLDYLIELAVGHGLLLPHAPARRQIQLYLVLTLLYVALVLCRVYVTLADLAVYHRVHRGVGIGPLEVAD